MFVLGAFGFLHELFNHHAERPFTLALCGALMGLPFVITADSLIRDPTVEDDAESGSADRWSHLP